MPEQTRNTINYMVVCVNDYADRHGLSRSGAFDYLRSNCGLAFLEERYEAEHTLSLDEALDDLDHLEGSEYLFGLLSEERALAARGGKG